ncbi:MULTISPECIES: hypothetical protein [Kribbella]|uniref:Uncharacterized protein n=1 Tax=Kribbella speibonae TaxID=1572660 RepID=A0A4R0ILT6_9ACTN|nr:MULTISPECIES: hypothetical protein [Kribbella]TCC33224.1 hypothetical protein E0H92_34330 [Kribbella speibonae]
MLRDLLEAEADVARERLGDRVTNISVGANNVEVHFIAHGVERRMRLTGADYDRRPLSLSFVDETGNPLPAEGWPPITTGGHHPVLGTPWTCLRGTLEYHLYAGHTAAADSWDASRADLRVPDVIEHVLQRCTA